MSEPVTALSHSLATAIKKIENESASPYEVDLTQTSLASAERHVLHLLTSEK